MHFSFKQQTGEKRSKKKRKSCDNGCFDSRKLPAFLLIATRTSQLLKSAAHALIVSARQSDDAIRKHDLEK